MVAETNITLAKAFDNSDIAFCVIELILDDEGQPCDWRFVYLNDALAKLEGVSKEVLLSNRFFEVFPNADRKWFNYYYPAAFENKNFTFDEVSEEIGSYLRIYCFPVSTGYCGCILEDIKELHNSIKREDEADSVIRGLAKEYESVWLIKAPELTLQLYQDNGFTRMDNDGKKNLQYPESVKRYISMNVHPEDRAQAIAESELSVVRKALEENGTYEIYFRKMVDNEPEYFQATAVSVSNSESFVMAIRNVNEIVKEQQQQKLALQTALESVKEANAAKTTFLSNMSHDIRTPMNAIMGFTSLALKHIDNQDKVQDYLEKISSSGNHLLSLINDVLDMSLIESGKIRLECSPCNLMGVLLDLSDIILPELQRKDLSFNLNTENVTDEAVICDKLRLNEILLNLVGNALKFTPAGGEISVMLIQKPGESEEKALYEFHIKDNGIGIGKDFIEHIFEPFERERTSTISGIQGTGLGMAITKKLVDMMGGDIRVISEKGVGAEFIFTIPMKKSKDAYIEYSGSEEEGSHTSISKLSGKRVLLVEDNELNREIATEILEEAGMLVESAENGRVALDMLIAGEQDRYQLVLMDIQMPVTNGYEAARSIRKHENKVVASVPIVAMTANAFAEDKKLALDAGMNAHITKPVRIEELFAVLETIIEGTENEC